MCQHETPCPAARQRCPRPRRRRTAATPSRGGACCATASSSSTTTVSCSPTVRRSPTTTPGCGPRPRSSWPLTPSLRRRAPLGGNRAPDAVSRAASSRPGRRRRGSCRGRRARRRPGGHDGRGRVPAHRLVLGERLRRRAGADQVAVAVGLVDPAHRAEVLPAAQPRHREDRRRPAGRAGPTPPPPCASVCGALRSGLSSRSTRRRRPRSISPRMATIASTNRSSSALSSLSVGSTISVPATGKLIVGAWKP